MNISRRYSKQRQMILDTIKANPVHPTADVVYKILTEEHPEISLGTVYRNLNLLVELGEIKKVESASAKEHFDGDNTFHPHLICNRCGNVVDVPLPALEEMSMALSQTTEHNIDDCKIIFHGVCKACLDDTIVYSQNIH